MADRRREITAAADLEQQKVCSFCVDKAEYIDYKDVAKLRRFYF